MTSQNDKTHLKCWQPGRAAAGVVIMQWLLVSCFHGDRFSNQEAEAEEGAEMKREECRRDESQLAVGNRRRCLCSHGDELVSIMKCLRRNGNREDNERRKGKWKSKPHIFSQCTTVYRVLFFFFVKPICGILSTHKQDSAVSAKCQVHQIHRRRKWNRQTRYHLILVAKRKLILSLRILFLANTWNLLSVLTSCVFVIMIKTQLYFHMRRARQILNAQKPNVAF